ncbi:MULTISPECIES: glycosyltransferase family 39 protein [Rhodopseudomonas]|uniref:glycosyltransferase family 39 protein n=1 Tax=Rhodopseudomonas TaxID=1073 RepID=UPI0009BBFEB2|nr:MULTISPECIES: glycosyltransferase family 39 protein [Rhodopseudomonas]MDF3809492.1 glycosyltransferase family 39 protein [Rhodopseudomonas sp. BAL398]WOK19368.1 glycosyltransferase family 39 protein [Rhodopseudomonas sp. BAL398]
MQALQTSPRRLLIWILCIYGGLWLVAAIGFPGLPASSYEMFLFGQEMQFGYWNDPPLAPWLTQTAYTLTGHWISSQFVLAVGSVVVTLYVVWKLGSEIVGQSGAALAVALTLLIYYFGPPATAYGPSVAQLPLWAATIYLYRAAVLKDGSASWILLGVASALLLYAKYTGGLLLIVLALHFFLTPEGRSRKSGTGPYLGLSTMLILLMPNLSWLAHHDYSPFSVDRPGVKGIWLRGWVAIKFLLAQLGFHAGVIAIAVVATLPKLPLQGEPVTLELGAPSRFDRSLILATASIPLLLIAAISLIAGIEQRAAVGQAMVALSGLALVVLLPPRIVLQAPRLAVGVWALVLIALPIGHVALTQAKARYGSRMPTQMVPAGNLSSAMQSIWHSKTSLPLEIVTGDVVQAGFVVMSARPRPSAFIDADFRKSPWITPERLQQSGTLVLWPTDQFPRTDELPAPYRAALGKLKPVFGTMVLPLGFGKLRTYGWAVLLPQPAKPAEPAKPAPAQ